MNKNIAIISPPIPGHLFNHCALGYELVKVGHKVTVYSIADNKEFVEQTGVSFYTIAEKEFPRGCWQEKWKPAMQSGSFQGDKHVLKQHKKLAHIMLEELSELFKVNNINFLIVDQSLPQGAALAQKNNIPYVTVCTLLSMHEDKSGVIPPIWTERTPANNVLQRVSNKFLSRLTNLFLSDFLKTTNKWCRKHNLQTYKTIENSYSKLLQIGVIPSFLDFPGRELPGHYKSVGPLLSNREDHDFPFYKLDGRPVIYVSMGTIRTRFMNLWNIILNALKPFNQYQVVLSTGTWTGSDIKLEVPIELNSPIIVPFTPQLKILSKAALCITHGGPGTILECLKFKVPMVAIPLGDDQPAMAARIWYHKIGTTLKLKGLNANKMEKAISVTLKSKELKGNIQMFSNKMSQYGGAKAAADMVGGVLIGE